MYLMYVLYGMCLVYVIHVVRVMSATNGMHLMHALYVMHVAHEKRVRYVIAFAVSSDFNVRKWYDVVWCGMCLYVGKWIWMERWMDGRMDRCNVTMHACMHAACKEVGR